MILLIDNNDSFTYNVLELLRKVTTDTVEIKRNAEVNITHLHPYSHIIFSPGPGMPTDFPIMGEILKKYDTTKSILGICLGHQAICQHYGGKLVNLQQVIHGGESEIHCNPSSRLFQGVKTMTVGRYHSWVVSSLPTSLEITAVDEAGIIMAVEHKTKQVFGIQFHPESYITKEGKQILQNFLYGISQ